MKHTLQIIVVIFATITTTCNGMETSYAKKATLLELPNTSTESYATFLDNDHIIIHGNNYCRITNILNNQDIRIIENLLPDSIIYFHPNKKHFALSGHTKIIVHETKSGKKVNTFHHDYYDDIFSVYFNPSDTNTFFTWKEACFTTALKQYNYITHTQIDTDIFNIIYTKNGPTIDINPVKQEICVQDQDIILYEYNNPTNNFIKSKKIKNPHPLSSIKYSSNGLFIACLARRTIDIIDNETQQCSCIYDLKNPRGALFSTEFHPNNVYLAILSAILKEKNERNSQKNDFNFILEYLDIYNKNVVTKISVSGLFPESIVETQRALSFAPNGDKLLIKVMHKTLIFPVPFKVQKHHQLHYFLFLSKNLTQHHEMPNDISYEIMRTLLTL